MQTCFPSPRCSEFAFHYNNGFDQLLAQIYKLIPSLTAPNGDRAPIRFTYMVNGNVRHVGTCPSVTFLRFVIPYACAF